jgi:hypothetical protein
VLFLRRWTHERVVVVRTPAPKDKASLLNHHRRCPWCRSASPWFGDERRTPCLSLLRAGLRVERSLFLQGLAHAIATGPSAPQRRPEVRPAPRRRTRGGRPCAAACCSLSPCAPMCSRKDEGSCDNPPRKIPYYRLKPIHFGH